MYFECFCFTLTVLWTLTLPSYTGQLQPLKILSGQDIKSVQLERLSMEINQELRGIFIIIRKEWLFKQFYDRIITQIDPKIVLKDCCLIVNGSVTSLFLHLTSPALHPLHWVIVVTLSSVRTANTSKLKHVSVRSVRVFLS